MPVLVLFIGLTATLLVATIVTGRGRPWGPVLIALYAFGMLAWMTSLSATTEAWIWMGLLAAGTIELGVAALLGLVPDDGSRAAADTRGVVRVVGALVGIGLTLFSGFLTLLGISFAFGGLPFVY